MIAEPTDTELKDSNDLVAQHEIESKADEFHLEKVQAENQKGPKEKSPTEDVKTLEQEPPTEAKDVSENEKASETEEFPQIEATAETEFPDENLTAGVEDLSEEEPPAIPKIADPPITMDKSAGIMDLNKLLENKKCMVLLGMGSWTCEEVSNFMDEVYHHYPEVQMIKYLGADMSSKFLICGPIKEGLGQIKNENGSFSIPIVCFLEQKNLVNIFAGLQMPEIKGALHELSSMPLSVCTFMRKKWS